MKSTIGTPDRQRAEEVAVAMLAWLAGNDDLMTRFLAMSGLTADGLRQVAGEPGFLLGVADFVMAHEPTLTAFAESLGLSPAEIAACHRALAGGEPNPWL